MTHRTTSSSNLGLSYNLYMHQVAIKKNLAICEGAIYIDLSKM
jgi:hypothetical protein